MVFLIQQTMLYAVPLMIVALAGVCAERSGVINLALEGIMIFGAFMGVIFIRMFQGMGFTADQGQLVMILAMLLTGICGVGFSMLLAFSAINLRADQTIGGYGTEHARTCGCTVLHLHDCTAEHFGNGNGKRSRLVHGSPFDFRTSEGLQLGCFD